MDGWTDRQPEHIIPLAMAVPARRHKNKQGKLQDIPLNFLGALRHFKYCDLELSYLILRENQ